MISKLVVHPNDTIKAKLQVERMRLKLTDLKNKRLMINMSTLCYTKIQ